MRRPRPRRALTRPARQRSTSDPGFAAAAARCPGARVFGRGGVPSDRRRRTRRARAATASATPRAPATRCRRRPAPPAAAGTPPSRSPPVRGSTARPASRGYRAGASRTAAGDDARRRDVGDASQREDPDSVEAEQPAGDRSRGRVEDEIHPRRRQVAAQAAGELADRELQSQGEQQQDHADRCPGADEFPGGRYRCKATVAERQAGEQVKRDRR